MSDTVKPFPHAAPPAIPSSLTAAEALRALLSADNYEALEALAKAYGIDVTAAVNVAVSDAFDSKMASIREGMAE